MKDIIKSIVKASPWRIYGDFVKQEEEFLFDKNTLTSKTDFYTIDAKYTCDDNGVCHYSGTLTNTIDKPLTFNLINSVFNLGGGEFEVYTQHNTWQNESTGAWQALNTAVCAEGAWSRTSSNCAPVIAVWNKQANRGIAFHLLPDFAWAMKVHYEWEVGEVSNCIVEIGMHNDNLRMCLNAGEAIPTPNIILYEFKNKTDLDAYKLHNYINKAVQKKPLSITYNTWMSHFDKVTFDNVFEQIKPASELGVEYFVIDAGWFGKGGEWWLCRGDWTENLTGAFYGRMVELANAVRDAGMHFGLWFEIESANDTADIVKAHPEYFIADGEKYFLDFAREDARTYIIEALSYNIDKYGIEYIKFDYNQDLHFDGAGRAFYDYLAGYDMVIDEIAKRYPALYMENCASGGQRVNLKNAMRFDGFWPSDDESPFDQVDIFTQTIKRLPPSYFDRWVTMQSLTDFEPVYMGDKTDKILACTDAEWRYATEVKASYLTGFLTGGPIGISCDLTKLTNDVLSLIGEHISKIKHERAFWNNAVCRILSHTDMVDVYEFSDMALNKIVITAFVKKSKQRSLMVYPVLNETSTYTINGENRLGAEMAENGILVEFDGKYTSKTVELNAILSD